MRYLQNVESKFRLHVRELVIFVRHGVAVLRFQPGIQERNRTIGADVVTFIVCGIVSERPQRESITVEIPGIMDEGQDEVSAPHIVHQVAEEKASVRIVAHILDNRPAVSVAVCFFQLLGRGLGKTLQQHGAYARVPCAVNDRLMSKNGIGPGFIWPTETKNKQHDGGEGLEA